MHPDAQVVMRGFQAFAEGDTAAMAALFSDDARWRTGGAHQHAGTYEGRDAVLRHLQDVSSVASIDNRPHDVLAGDDHVVVLVDSRLEKDGVVLASQVVLVCHVSGGKIAEAWAIPYDQAAENAFWG